MQAAPLRVMLKRTLHGAWLLLAAGLLLVAVLLTVARVWAPSLGDYRHAIETAVSAALQRPLTIGRVEATWRGLRPVLRLRDVVIQGVQAPQPLIVREIQVSLDTGYFLRYRALRLAGVDIIGIALTLARDQEGRLVLKEFADRAGDDFKFDALAAMSRLSIHDAGITVVNIPDGTGTQHFSAVNVSLTNAGDDHYVTGHALLPGHLGDRIEIIAHLQGDTAHPATWHGRAYFKGQSLALSSLLAPALEQTQAVQGIADLRLWAELAALRITSVSGELDVDALRMEHGKAGRQSLFAADRLQTQFGWQQAGQGWRAVVQRLQVTRAGHDWKTGDVSLAGVRLADGLHLRVDAPLVDLDEVTGLLPAIPGLDAALRDRVVDAQPTGLLEDLSCAITHTDAGITLDGFSARFTGLGVLQTGAIPYLAGLDGSIKGDAQAGTVQLSSTALVVHDEHLFRTALQFDRAGGELYWRTTGDSLQIGSESLVAVNPHLSLDARFSVFVPHDGGAPSTDTVIAVRDFDIARIGDYLPALIMKKTGVAWMDRSLTGGKVHDGSVIINGRLDQLPFDHGEGRLEVRLPVSGATLDFNEHWSPVTQLDAQVDFTGRQMDIHTRKGFIRSAALHDVHAQIRDLASPHLTITGDVHGALPVMLAELGSSPLGDTYGGFVDRVNATGNADLSLDIHVPLVKDDERITVAGRIGLRDNILKVKESDIVLEHIGGRLDFDDHGIRGDGLKANLYGRKASVRVWTERDKPVTHISLDGKLALLDHVLEETSPLRALLDGEPDWHVQLTTRGKPSRGSSADVGLRIASTLQGLAIDLPAPFGKTAAEPRALSIEVAALEASERYVRVDYGASLQGVLVLGRGERGFQLQRGNIALGGETPVAPQIPQLLISGKLDRFRLADWKKQLARDGAGAGLPLRVSVKVADLEVLGKQLRDAGLDITKSGQVWTIKTIGPSAEGVLQLTQSDTGIDKITMDMERLVLETVGEGTATTETPPRPTGFPELQIDVRKLVYNNIEFGKLELQAQQVAGGFYRFNNLALTSKMLSMQLSGDWRQLGDDQISHADVTVTGGNVGALLDALGYQKVMKDGHPSGNLKVSWTGAPWDVKTEIINGGFDVVIKDGQLLDVEPGATGRALGLLSLAKLPRRLILDFTDLFGTGFGFERIGGNFVLDNGNAYTDNLVIDGPAAKIEISGRVGLAAQDYDELVTVTPYLNSSLPLAGALAGGPAVGAAMIVAEKLLGGKLGVNEIARKQYAVTGPWANPVVARLDSPQPAVKKPPDDAADADGFIK